MPKRNVSIQSPAAFSRGFYCRTRLLARIDGLEIGGIGVWSVNQFAEWAPEKSRRVAEFSRVRGVGRCLDDRAVTFV